MTDRTSTLACGHRGNFIDRPEQTIAAYARAIDLGAHMIELDVRATSDGQLAVIHDAMVERTTNGRGAVSERTLAELRDLDAGSWFADEFRGERIPTLDEVLALVARTGVTPCIEVKADSAGEANDTATLLGAWLSQRNLVARVCVSSFHLDALASAAVLVPGLRLVPWMDEFSPADVVAHIADARRLGAEGIFHTAALLNHDQVAAMRREGLDVWVWSADDQASLEQAVALEADVISCSDISRLMSVLAAAS